MGTIILARLCSIAQLGRKRKCSRTAKDKCIKTEVLSLA